MPFDARVIGVPDFVALVKQRLGKDEGAYASSKFEAAQEALGERYGEDFAGQLESVLNKRGPVCTHLSIERNGFLVPLQEWATARDGTTPELVWKDNAWTEYLHTALIGRNDCLILPLDFAVPNEVRLEERAFVFPVCSGPRILKEIEIANKVLKVEKAFKFPKVPDFMRAKKAEIAKLEREEELDHAFWAKFGLVVLRHLVQKSQDTGLPVILAEAVLEPVR